MAFGGALFGLGCLSVAERIATPVPAYCAAGACLDSIGALRPAPVNAPAERRALAGPVAAEAQDRISYR